jgi:hypothetical protein
MGHIHLGVLPKSRKWRDVVDLLADGAADQSVVAASARAAERDFLDAARDPVFVEAVRLLLSIPLAARKADFGDALRSLDLPIEGEVSLFGLVSAAMTRLDRVAREHGKRNDLGELAARALARTLGDCIGGDLPGLFDLTAADVQAATRKLSYSNGIAFLSRAFFGELVGTTLSYWLDRVLAQHVGAGERFENVAARSAFDVALRQYTSEATRIIQEFSGGWYGKTLHERGGISAHDATVFGAVALKKISAELQTRWDADG